jgi:hypothetical protein
MEKIDPDESVDTAQFVTLHDLARDCDVRQKNIWYRLKKLMAQGKLDPGADYFTQDYVDPLHFEWKVNPWRYLELSPKHRERFDARQHRIRFESEHRESASTADANDEEPARTPESTRTHIAGNVESNDSSEGSGRVLEKLLEQLDHQNQTIGDLQTTIRAISSDSSSFGKSRGRISARRLGGRSGIRGPLPSRATSSSRHQLGS